ncbi:hypothetical protein [Corynebacterium cystitidis]|nr:hypothetical protein [Corynebacterium cystitidis]
MQYSTETPPTMTKDEAVDFSRFHVMWMLGGVAFELRRAEENEMPRTARMKYRDAHGDTRFLDGWLHPIDGWVIDDRFLVHFATTALPDAITPDTERADLSLPEFDEGPYATLWNAVAAFYARIYDSASSELDGLLDFLYAQETTQPTNLIARLVSGLTLAAFALGCAEAENTPTGIFVDAVNRDGTYIPATKAWAGLSEIIQPPLRGQDAPRYLELFESDMLETNPL